MNMVSRTTTPRKPLDEYQQRALATRKRRAPAAKLARLALKAAIERSKAIGTAAAAAKAAI